MDKTKIAQELVRLAGRILKEADWKSVRKDVDISMRNKEMHDSLSSFAPALSKEMKKRMSMSLNKAGFDVKPNDLNRVWSQYLAYVDIENNNNKYHYYVVYSFAGPDGLTRYIAGNCSGRIGIVERAYDLTMKFLKYYPTDDNRAINAAERHMSEKLRKGYEKVKMVRG